MKLYKLITCLFALFTLLGCQDDAINAGSSTLSNSDEIKVKADTFSLSSVLDSCAAHTLTPDSFLLGECDTHFGTIQADLLTQLACPEGFQYPYAETAKVDSIYLYIYYNSWYGDGKAPLGITVYEMDRASLSETGIYPSNLRLEDYCSLEDSTHIASASRIIIPAEPTDSFYQSSLDKYQPFIRIKLTDAFAKRFFAIQDFSSQEAFNNAFKGLYITSDFGGSNILYVTNICMDVYYHFTRPVAVGEDTVLHDMKSFYANSEVRQVNRYVYPDRQEILDLYTQRKDTNYIISPANIYTQLSLRMDSIYQRIEDQLGRTSDYRVYVNQALLTLDVLYDIDLDSDRPRDQWDVPANTMLLIKADRFTEFFAKNELPSDTSAILATLTATEDSLNNISYTYTYDLSALLTQQLRSDEPVEELKFMLVPVAITTSSSSSSTAITSVKQLQTISATRIRSSHNSQPIDLEMVYSGFSFSR